jgi:hypothetical protein
MEPLLDVYLVFLVCVCIIRTPIYQSEPVESGLSSSQSSRVTSRDITPDTSLSQNIERRAFKKPKKRERPIELHQS